MSRRVLVVCAAALLVVAASCTSDDQGSTAVTTSPPTTEPPIIPCQPATDVPEAEGKPVVEMPAESVRELVVNDLVIGDGTELTAADTAIVHLVGVACSTGEQFESTWEQGAPLDLAGTIVIPGVQQGLLGMKTGGRRQIVVPQQLGFGAAGMADVGPYETLVFVVDLVAVTPPKVSVAGQPCAPVTNLPPAEGKPPIEVEGGPAPTEMVTDDLVVGTGDEVNPQSLVTYHYLIVACSTGQQWDSTWDRNNPVEVPFSQLQRGAAEGMAGMREGGVRLIILPPDKAYGASPPPDSPLQLDESLIYVVEIVDVAPLSVQSSGGDGDADTDSDDG